MKSLSTTKRSQINGLRKTPLYDNYKLLAQDGELLSTINKKKVQWYLQKGLAGMYVPSYHYCVRTTDDREQNGLFGLMVSYSVGMKQ